MRAVSYTHLDVYKRQIEMRALLPFYFRPLGYFIIALALFLPFIFLLWGKVTDANLLFYKECSKQMCIRDRQAIRCS